MSDPKPPPEPKAPGPGQAEEAGRTPAQQQVEDDRRDVEREVYRRRSAADREAEPPDAI